MKLSPIMAGGIQLQSGMMNEKGGKEAAERERLEDRELADRRSTRGVRSQVKRPTHLHGEKIII